MFLALFVSIPVCKAQNTDIDLLKKVNQHRNRSGDIGMTGITNSVYPVSAIIPVTELVAGYHTGNKKLIAGGWQTIGGLGLNFIVTFSLKYGVNRPRPYTTYSFIDPYHHDSDPSFPSGHTSFSFNTATSLSILYPRWYIVVPAYTWAAAVGYSRMYLGMHYPTDIIAGAIIGAGTSLLSYHGNKWLQHRKHKTTPVIEH